MQERRTTIRVSHHGRAQYCPSEDFLPRDGSLIDLSERGIGLSVSESHPQGEQITVTFSLPDTEEPLTATGVVRWSAAPTLKWGRHRLGLEWSPLASTTHQRLHVFLSSKTRVPESARLWPRIHQSWTAHRLAWVSGLLGVLTIAVACGWWVRALEDNNRQLQIAVQQRTAMLRQVEQRDAVLQQELRLAKTHLASTSEEVAQLDHDAQQMERAMQQLTHDVESFHQSYSQVKDERDYLTQQMVRLAQQHAAQSSVSVSARELRRVIRDALAAHRKTKHQLHVKGFRNIDSERPQSHNGGYVTWDGRQTSNASTVWIRVHDPESVSSVK